MAKLATRPKRAATAPIKSTKGRKPDTLTHEGGAGFERDAKSALFLLAVTNMVSENTFYENGKNRDKRFVTLIKQVALEDPDWVARFVPYLRNTMNMRSASIVMAAELVHAKLTKPVPTSKITNRTIIDSAIQRADEPAEMLGYWMSEWGKNFPQPVKRGVADAAVRLYSEWSLIKNDGGDKPIRFADVIDLTHPTPKAPWQDALFDYALDSRHKRENVKHEVLATINANITAMALGQETFREVFDSSFVQTAGLTWEQASSKYGKLDAKFWEAMIPNMGIFALVRNLRNFDDTKINKEAQDMVRARLTDAEVIAKSRMFPLRFFTAFIATKSLTYGRELEEAINLSLKNVPALSGNTLVLCDMSGSMDYALSGKSDVKRLAPASIFAAALALRAEKATLVAFSDQSKVIPFRKDSSVILATKDIVESMPHMGTNTWSAVNAHLNGHDRIVIVTDEQTQENYQSKMVPETTPIYVFNLAGYAPGSMPSGKKNRYVFGGLTDAGFVALELLERGKDQSWPF